MKQDEVPQDKGNLSDSNLKELVYAVDDKGNYTTALSSGWEPKTIALSNSIDEINQRISDAREQVRNGQASPLLYFMEVSKMDLTILSGYVGMWKWRIKRHFKPDVFKGLNDKILQKYADAFEVPVSQLKNYKPE
ncbi:MAG TPA: hypothetical protein VGB50_08115 [Flavobacterium sp.]|jgi:hypothetical protein